MEWDKGPGESLARLFEQAPLAEYKEIPEKFRLEWGPIFYRGRTDGSARVLVIGQDPAADENVARRILVGTAGRRVQGFLGKLGLTRSYIMVNSVLYSIYGQFDQTMRAFMDRPAISTWHNALLDAVANPELEAILAFGQAARHALEKWPGTAAFDATGRVFYLMHPTARPESAVLENWNSILSRVGTVVTPDADGEADLAKYAGEKFAKTDLMRIPLHDFSFGVPQWSGSGDNAVRLSPGKPLPAFLKDKTAIAWVPSGKEG
jgi:uracil-DNA glycosylase